MPARGISKGMRVIHRPVAIFLALVFSLVLSGPAFSGMDCSNHMAPGAADSGKDHQGHHADGQKADTGLPCHGQQQLSSADLHTIMVPGDCCQQAECLSAPSVATEMRFDFVKLKQLVSKVKALRFFDHISPLALEMFAQYRVQQRPHLSLPTPWRAHFATTTRQNL